MSSHLKMIKALLGAAIISLLAAPAMAQNPASFTAPGAEPGDGFWQQGETLVFVAGFDSDVTVTGTPELQVLIGAAVVNVPYVGPDGGDNATMRFEYPVSTGDEDLDGVAMANNSIVNVGGSTISTANLNFSAQIFAVNAALTATVVDALAPALTETSPVNSPSSSATPAYSFSTTEAGTLAVGGSCGAVEETSPTLPAAGSYNITLTAPDNSSDLADGDYNDCTVEVTDAAGNTSSSLNISNFRIAANTVPSQAVPLSYPWAIALMMLGLGLLARKRLAAR
ncbi:MAG: hypothetical protein OIF38_09350 [Cellvibrionaceae bacterium]|nr:hypothetical protein [Cellvibrionaceae bacterium]